uniref:Uncharacterized protein n=1 Tax=Panagrolaimus superbus TaxID=310955 RepID=A0A914YLZ9_9BILA
MSQKVMEILEQFLKKSDDYYIQKGCLYALFIHIAVYHKDKDETKKLLKLAFDCPKHKEDPKLHFFLLFVQRKYVSRDKRKELSTKMFERYERFKNGRMKEEKLDAFYNLYEDYFFEDNMIKAEEMLWKIYSDKECLKMDKKGFVKKNLITCKFLLFYRYH